MKKSYDMNKYWENILKENFSLKGVGWQNWPESYNMILYKKYLKAFNKVIEDLNTEFEFKLDEDLKILEIGPGVGFYTQYFFRRNIKKYFGIDISNESIKKLKKKFPNYEFLCSDISDIEVVNFLGGQKFDLICVNDVLLHVTDDKKFRNALKILSGLLNDKGFLIIGDAITIYREKDISEDFSQPHNRSRHIDYLKNLLKEEKVFLKKVYHRMNFFLNENFDFKYKINEKFYRIYFYFLNGGLNLFKNVNFMGYFIGYPLSFIDSIITPFQNYSKNCKFLLFRKEIN